MQNVKQKMTWLWLNSERILIIIFFLTFTLNIRKVFLTPFSVLNGGFNEYLTISFSWADLLMITAILIYTIKYIISQFSDYSHLENAQSNINNKKSILSSFPNVTRETFYLLIFLGWVGLSIFWSKYKPIAIYRFLTFVEISLFAYICVGLLRQSKWLKMSFLAIIINGFFQAVLGIAQLIHNGSLKLNVIGESFIGPNLDGVAKIIIIGEKHIRAYGTLPHPNILAGFLIAPLFLIFSDLFQRYLISNNKENNNTSKIAGDLKVSARDIQQVSVSCETSLGFVPRWFLLLSLLVIGFGFFSTFSRSAFLSIAVGILFFVFSALFRSRNPLNILKIFYKHIIALAFGLSLVLILLAHLTSFFSNQTLEERILYHNVSHETILSHPLLGNGIGQFVLNEYILHPNFESWQYQPVHDVYLLMISELGLIGLALFFLFLLSFFSNIFKRDSWSGSILTYLTIYCIIFSFLLLSFFDHYFWDIKIGTIIFALPFLLLYTLTKN